MQYFEIKVKNFKENVEMNTIAMGCGDSLLDAAKRIYPAIIDAILVKDELQFEYGVVVSLMYKKDDTKFPKCLNRWISQGGCTHVNMQLLALVTGAWNHDGDEYPKMNVDCLRKLFAGRWRWRHGHIRPKG